MYFSYVIYHASWQPVPRACCGPRDANEMHPAVVRPPQQASRWHSAKLLQHKRALPRHDEVASSSRSLRQTSPARMDHHRNRPDCWGDRSASSVLRTPTPARLTNSAILRTTPVSPSNGRGRARSRAPTQLDPEVQLRTLFEPPEPEACPELLRCTGDRILRGSPAGTRDGT